MILTIWLLYGIPSLILIGFFMRFLNRQEFKYSFYRIVQCDMVVNVFCYLNTWILRFCHVELTFRMMIWVDENLPIVLWMSAFFTLFFFNAQALSVTTMSVQRLWTSKSPFGNQFWCQYYRHVYGLLILISLFFPSILMIFELYLPYRYDRDAQMFIPKKREPLKSRIFGTFFQVQSLTYFVVIFAVNIWTIITVKKHLANVTTSHRTKNMIRNLTTIAFINTIVFFVETIWQLFGGYVFDELEEITEFHIIMIMSDVLSLSLPYVMLAFDQNVRNTLFRVFGGVMNKVEVAVEILSHY